jgi:hypothetical protein
VWTTQGTNLLLRWQVHRSNQCTDYVVISMLMTNADLQEFQLFSVGTQGTNLLLRWQVHRSNQCTDSVVNSMLMTMWVK